MRMIFWRPSTPNWYEEKDGRQVRHMIVKRCCNGCARELGDANDAELDAAVTGAPLPDVRVECGCWTSPEIQRLVAERDSARLVAVRLEQENARLEGLLACVAHDLREMDGDEAIDLESWPAACDVVIHVFVEDRFAEVPS